MDCLIREFLDNSAPSVFQLVLITNTGRGLLSVELAVPGWVFSVQ